MLNRIGGGTDGIKEYLEHGQKQGRAMARDELDERVILSGDLDLTDSIIKSMENDGEKYLHCTLSFKEDNLDVGTLKSIANDFEEFAFSAYAKDEYNFYAEAHLPKVKSYTNEKAGEFVERKPHIHAVIPKENLLNGQHLNPFGVVEQNEKFLDAFQEHINNKYGLASPKDNRRIEFTNESEMISRYKGDVFDGQKKDLKGEILSQVLDRNIERYEDFQKLVSEFGETKARNTGKSNEYLNVKEEGAAKGVNLKDYVFSREFIELSAENKKKQLSDDVQKKYETQGQQRKDPQEIEKNLQHWHETRAKEIKYLNSGNRKLWNEYRAAGSDERKQILTEREKQFYSKNRKELSNEQPRRRTGHFSEFGRGYGFKRSAAIERTRTTARNAGNRQRDISAARPITQAQSINRVRSLSSIGVVRFSERSEMLLPDHAPNQLEHQRTERANELRRDSVSQRGVKATGRYSDNVTSQLTRDLNELKLGRNEEQQTEFQEIKQNLDARRLLSELSQSHGVIPEKYEVTKAKDGSDRIKCGNRNLNVSDFLTKELNMPWKDAAKALQEAYGRQQGKEPARSQNQQPKRQLWSEFQDYKKSTIQQRNALQWDEQRLKEKSLREAIKKEFYAKRSKVQGNSSLSPAQRKAAVSIARMERLTQETALREQIKKERDQLKAEQRKPAREQYRDFLSEKAQTGDELALSELRRMRPEPPEKEKNTDKSIKPAERQPEQVRAPIHKAPDMKYQIHKNGDVTYQRNGRDVLIDRGRAVEMVQEDKQTIETGLRLAQQKFGNKLALNGTQEFKETAARVAADAGLNVEFNDPQLNKIMQERRAEIEATRAKESEARAMAREFIKQKEQERNQPQEKIQPIEKAPVSKAPTIESKEPNTSESRYTGEVQAVDENYVYQRYGRDVIRHDRAHFNEPPKVGDEVRVTYNQGKATVKNIGQERDNSNTLGR
jgi:hypothetical protein